MLYTYTVVVVSLMKSVSMLTRWRKAPTLRLFWFSNKTFLFILFFSPTLLFLKRGGNQHDVDENGEVNMSAIMLNHFVDSNPVFIIYLFFLSIQNPEIWIFTKNLIAFFARIL